MFKVFLFVFCYNAKFGKNGEVGNSVKTVKKVVIMWYEIFVRVVSLWRERLIGEAFFKVKIKAIEQ